MENENVLTLFPMNHCEKKKTLPVNKFDLDVQMS